MIPSTTGLLETTDLGSALDQTGINKGLTGGFIDNKGVLAAACHPTDKLVALKKVEVNFTRQPAHKIFIYFAYQYILI